MTPPVLAGEIFLLLLLPAVGPGGLGSLTEDPDPTDRAQQKFCSLPVSAQLPQ